jgi:hypothetical protein
MTKNLTFIDASVLIYAAKKPTAETFPRYSRSLLILSDPDREFVTSDFLQMEVMPIPVYFGRKREMKFYEHFFDSVSHWVEAKTLLAPADRFVGAGPVPARECRRREKYFYS